MDIGMSYKVYVDVTVKITKEGLIVPKTITWENGKSFDIMRIQDSQRMASLKAGGVGIRYTVIIDNKEAYLYLEEDKFFVERRV